MAHTFKVSDMAIPCKSSTMICRACGKSNPTRNDARCAGCGGICDPAEMVRKPVPATIKTGLGIAGIAGIVAVVQQMNTEKAGQTQAPLKTATAQKTAMLTLGNATAEVRVA